MGNEQSSVNQNPTGSEPQLQRAGSNQKLFVAIVISVLLTAMLTGFAVYFWQKYANDKAVSSLEQKIAFLERQKSKMKDETIIVHPTASPTLLPTPTTDPTANWSTYSSDKYGFKFRYPPSLLMKSLTITPDQGIPIHFALGERLEIVVRDPKLPEEEITRNWINTEVISINGLKILKEQSQTSAIGGNPPYLTHIQYMIELPRANLFIVYTEPSENDYKQFSLILDQILSTFESTN